MHGAPKCKADFSCVALRIQPGKNAVQVHVALAQCGAVRVGKMHMRQVPESFVIGVHIRSVFQRQGDIHTCFHACCLHKARKARQRAAKQADRGVLFFHGNAHTKRLCIFGKLLHCLDGTLCVRFGKVVHEHPARRQHHKRCAECSGILQAASHEIHALRLNVCAGRSDVHRVLPNLFRMIHRHGKPA